MLEINKMKTLGIFFLAISVLLVSACDNRGTTTTTQIANVPQLINPKPGKVMQNGDTERRISAVWNFDWSDVADSIQYHFYLKYPSARNPAIDNDNITESSFIYAFMGNIKSHYGWTWKVRAMVDGVWSEWSETWTFDVEFAETE